MSLAGEGAAAAVSAVPAVPAVPAVSDAPAAQAQPGVPLAPPSAPSSALPAAAAMSAAQAAAIPTPGPVGPPPAASPTVRKFAHDLGIDLRLVRGSERGGRVVLADLKAYIQRLQAIASAPPAGGPSPSPGQSAAPVAAPVDFGKWGAVERKKMTTLRRTISDRMVQSWVSIPHINQFDEVDITGLLALKKKYDAKYQKQGARLTLTAFAIAALVPSLKKHPLFNSSIDEVSGEIVFKRYYHLGIAVDTEHGLIVPVLRDADKKSLLEIARGIETLAERARTRKLTLDEMQGGTFSISNQGGIGSGHFTPIINKPEVAILGIGRGAVKAAVHEKKIEPRTMLPLTLSYDHRIIDGADAARFMVDLVKAFEGIPESDLKI
jgi:pyruvate dehydrogenase E2 component (dihydrolipoamide acetyltransferase)